MQSSSRNGASVRLLAIHTTEGIMRATDLRDWKTWTGSAHASADQYGGFLDGPGDGFVDYNRASWTLRSGNAVSDNIELCAQAKWTRADWLARPKLVESAALWLARRKKARPHIPLVKLSPAEVRAGKAGVIGHVDWTQGMKDGSHWDPGPGFPWDLVLARANALVSNSPGSAVTILPVNPPVPEDDMTPQESATLTAAHDNAAEARRLAGEVSAKLDRVLATLPQIAEDASESRRMDGVQLGAIAPAAGEVVIAGATFDPAAVASAVKALGPELANDVASRLRITAA